MRPLGREVYKDQRCIQVVTYHSADGLELPEDTREYQKLGDSIFLTLLVISFQIQIGNPLWHEIKAANSTKSWNVLIHVKILKYFNIFSERVKLAC